MAFVDGVIFLASSAGTADFVEAAAVQGYQTLEAAAAIDGATYGYRAEVVDNSGNITQWEVGEGIYTLATSTIARTTVLFNDLGNTSRIAFTDPPQVMITALAEQLSSGFGSGWAQVTGSPGDTHTTPINAPGGSGQAGPDILMFAGNGDGAGAAGNIVLEIASGAQTLDPTNSFPITGVVVLDATNQTGFNFVVKDLGGNVGRELDFWGAPGILQGGDINFTSGVGANQGGQFLFRGGAATGGSGTGGVFRAFGGPGFIGGGEIFDGGLGHGGGGGSSNVLAGNDFSGGAGGVIALTAGIGTPGGSLSLTSGNGSGAGNAGDINITTNSDGGFGRAGDLIVALSTGTTRNGQFIFFPGFGLPTTDPSISGAVWTNNDVLFLSGAANYSGPITAASLAAAMVGITVTNGIITAFS